MPELPEVETTRRGIEPYILGKRFSNIIIREHRLRWPVNYDLATELTGLAIQSIARRAKYLLIRTEKGTLIIHLGMSGSLQITPSDKPVDKHDHVDFVFSDDTTLRFNDTRRFGAILWTTEQVEKHPLIKYLGPEPLSNVFTGEQLYRLSRKRKLPVKSFIMDNHVVVGVGNIYANEALFKAGIHPKRQAGRISLSRYKTLALCIKTVLKQAIEQGGTTLRDFVNESGKPGYFQQSLSVYGHTGELCTHCSEIIKQIRIGQRSSYFCPACQK